MVKSMKYFIILALAFTSCTKTWNIHINVQGNQADTCNCLPVPYTNQTLVQQDFSYDFKGSSKEVKQEVEAKKASYINYTHPENVVGGMPNSYTVDDSIAQFQSVYYVKKEITYAER